MSNPRTGLDFEGIATPEDYATFDIDGVTIVYDGDEPGGAAATMIDHAVMFTGNKQVGLTSDAAGVAGKLIHVESDGKCRVQTGGWMKLPSGAGATITRGLAIVGDLDTAARGFIRGAASGVAAELAVARGEIMDNSDTAAVWVKL